jgi:hypothetical protein
MLSSIQDVYSQIDLDDLRDSEASAGIILEMQDRQRYFEGQIASAASAENIARMVSFYIHISLLVSSLSPMSPGSGHESCIIRNEGQSARLGYESCAGMHCIFCILHSSIHNFHSSKSTRNLEMQLYFP